MAKQALIVGGGIGGMCCAIALDRAGWSVDLIDIDPTWRALGAGLTLGAATLRALDKLGVLEEVTANGFVTQQITMMAGDGSVVGRSTPPSAAPGLPALAGILRPVMHKILSDRVRKLAKSVRLGVKVTDLNDRKSTVAVHFSDGAEGEYDLVIGADSINSAMRRRLFENAYEPRFSGHACWRLLVPKPAEQDGMILLTDGSGIGINPVSETQSYVFMTVADPGKTIIPEKDQIEALRPLLIGHGPMIDTIRQQMNESYQVNYRPLESLIIDGPWHRGRVLLIGDAAHSTTPHLGHGAGLAVEDAVVLGEELAQSDDLDTVFERFMARRLPRAGDVIETSWTICRMELASEYEEAMAIHFAAMGRLLAPI